MGRKRKTRWRRLSIGEISGNEEEELLDGSPAGPIHLSVKCPAGVDHSGGIAGEENGSCDSCNKLLNGKMSNGSPGGTTIIDPSNPDSSSGPNSATMTHNNQTTSSSNSSVNSGPSSSHYQNSSASSTSSQYGNNSSRQYHGSYNPHHHHHHNNHSNPQHYHHSNHHHQSHHHHPNSHYSGKEPGSNNYHNGHYSNYYGARNNYNNYRNNHHHNHQYTNGGSSTTAPTNNGSSTTEEAGSSGTNGTVPTNSSNPPSAASSSSTNPNNGHGNYHYPSSRGGYNGGRFRKPRPYGSYYYSNNGSTGKGANGEGPNRPSYNQDEYTKITTPRQDVLFKKGYLSQKKSQSVESNSATTTPSASTNGTPDTQSTNGVHSDYSEGYENGETDGGVHYDDTVYYGAPPDAAVFTDPHTGQVFYGHCPPEYYDAYPVMVAGYPAPVYYHMPYQTVDWNGMPAPIYSVMGPAPIPMDELPQQQNYKGAEPMEVTNPSEEGDGTAGATNTATTTTSSTEGNDNPGEGKAEAGEDEVKKDSTGSNESEEMDTTKTETTAESAGSSSASAATSAGAASTAATSTTPSSSGDTTVTSSQPQQAPVLSTTAQPVPLPPPVGMIAGPGPHGGIPPPPPPGAMMHHGPPHHYHPHHHHHHPAQLPPQSGVGPPGPHHPPPPPPAYMAGPPPSSHPGSNHHHGLPPGPPMPPPHHMNPMPGPFIYPHPAGFVYGPPIYHGYMVPYGGGAVTEYSSSSSRKKRKKRRRKKDGQLTDEGSETASVYSNAEDDLVLEEDSTNFPPIIDNMAEEVTEDHPVPSESFTNYSTPNVNDTRAEECYDDIESSENSDETLIAHKIPSNPNLPEEETNPSHPHQSSPTSSSDINSAIAQTEDLPTPVVDQVELPSQLPATPLRTEVKVTTVEESQPEINEIHKEEQEEAEKDPASSSKRSIKKPADLDVTFETDPTDTQFLHLQRSPEGNEPSSPDSFNTTQSMAGSEAAPGDTLSFSETDQLNRTTSVDEVEEDLPQEVYYGYEATNNTSSSSTVLPSNSSVQLASVDDPTAINEEVSPSASEEQPEIKPDEDVKDAALPIEHSSEEEGILCSEKQEAELTVKAIQVAQEEVPEIKKTYTEALKAALVNTEPAVESNLVAASLPEGALAQEVAKAVTEKERRSSSTTVEKTVELKAAEEELRERAAKERSNKWSPVQYSKDSKYSKKAKDKRPKASKESKDSSYGSPGKTVASRKSPTVTPEPVEEIPEISASALVTASSCSTTVETLVPHEDEEATAVAPEPSVTEVQVDEETNGETISVETKDSSETEPASAATTAAADANQSCTSKSKKKNRKSPAKLIDPVVESPEGSSSTLALKKAADEVELFKPAAIGDRPQSITLAVSEWLKAQGDDVFFTPLISSDDNELTQEDEADDEDTDDGGGSGSRKASVQEIMRQNQKNVYGNPWVVPSNKSGTGKKGRLFLTSRRVFRVSGFKGYRALQSVKRINDELKQKQNIVAATAACPNDGTSSRVAPSSTSTDITTVSDDRIPEEGNDVDVDDDGGLDDSKMSCDKSEESQHSNYDSGLELSSPENGEPKTPPEFPPHEKTATTATTMMMLTAAATVGHGLVEDTCASSIQFAAATSSKPELESISSNENNNDSNEICNPLNFSKYYQLGIVCDDDESSSSIQTGGDLDPISLDVDDEPCTEDPMTVSVSSDDLGGTSSLTTPTYYNSLKLVCLVEDANQPDIGDDGNNNNKSNNGDGQSIPYSSPLQLSLIPQACEMIKNSHVMNADVKKSLPYCDDAGKKNDNIIIHTNDDKLEIIGASPSGSPPAPVSSVLNPNIKHVTTSENFAYIDLDEPPSPHSDHDDYAPEINDDKKNLVTSSRSETSEFCTQANTIPAAADSQLTNGDDSPSLSADDDDSEAKEQDALYEDIDDDDEEIPVYESPDMDFLPEGHPRRSTASAPANSVKNRLGSVVANGGAGTGGQKIPCAICCVVQ